MIKIGITGGIGSGKSYLCKLLKEKGIPVYNCDDEAKRLMTESATIRQQLCQLIGDEAYVNGLLNKPVIAAFLFANAENATAINKIVHPIVKQDFAEWALSQDCLIVAQECALLFESGFSATVDVVVEVYAPEHLRLQRAMIRDKVSAQQIKARMAQQMDEEEKRRRADFCILNDGSNLEPQLEHLLDRIMTMLQDRKESQENDNNN